MPKSLACLRSQAHTALFYFIFLWTQLYARAIAANTLSHRRVFVRCIKLTNDPPSGLRANLKQAFASISREEYSDLEPR